MIGLCAVLCAQPARAAVPQAKLHALWVYPDPTQPAINPVLNGPAGQQLIANASASKVNMIYLSVYSSTTNNKGLYMYDETLIASFITAAHAAGMQVYAAYGDTDWPTLGCGTSASPSFPIARLLEIAAYNATNPLAAFNGVILDVEPVTADQNLLSLYACSLQTTLGNNLGLSVAISAFWNNTIGTGGPAYQQILNMNFVNVVVMGYRSLAGTFGANDNGMLDLDTPALSYKNNPYTVVVGLETQNLGAADPTNTQSFYATGQAALDYQAQSVANQLAANGIQFAGFAIDNYDYAYLSGTAAWPATDPAFPTAASVETVSAGVASVQIGTVTATVTFASVSNANATVTVTPLNPATQTPTPTGFQLTTLAFDVSTTAIFTGPATVCFTVPSLDAATFASLRILHYVNGVAIDQTILSGPNAPNAATQTICASVTSFSPFVLAKAFTALAEFHVPFAALYSDDFLFAGDFTLPAGASLTTATELTFTLGTGILDIPAGQLKADFGGDHIYFEGTVKTGANLLVGLSKQSSQAWTFVVAGDNLNLTTQPEPLHVELQVGKDVGSAIVSALVFK
jgi:hypothetical protein